MGYPSYFENPKYFRMHKYWNIAFVFLENADIQPYEPVLCKLGCIIESLELETEFLSNRTSITQEEEEIKKNDKSIQTIIKEIFEKLKKYGDCNVKANAANRIRLKLFPNRPQPDEVYDYQVPIIIKHELWSTVEENWDLTLKRIIPHIDNVSYIKRISERAKVDIELCRKCIRQLLYYGYVAMVDIFQYCNVYVPTKEINKLYTNRNMQTQCCQYIKMCNHGKTPLFPNVFRYYCSLRRGFRMLNFVTTFNLLEQNIDPRKFIYFGVVNKIIRRVHKYPITRPPDQTEPTGYQDSLKTIRDGREGLDGTSSFDEIICQLIEKPHAYDLLEKDMRSCLDAVIIHR